MAIFDARVLGRPLGELHKTLHTGLYWYELVSIPRDVSLYRPGAESTPERSIILVACILIILRGITDPDFRDMMYVLPMSPAPSMGVLFLL